ncbi:uncharacterized protein LAESUDRAFT_808469 [Laetiporus sulphureus 93-53]|uniref:CLASP N-terminal domain-containing protein n=1 Tax=Laetiporus sulphureus 93-53 TaxID=1314785 RepID=A0A165IER4_9APHY|nr:uncharacterized protein LAESUDRAFT_808469 [Laetiporus sulphureus 93-53]KZT12975.1 hypothetical protein LAESUDRAFT_808469 [Laetiporus sulphureus 93-53]
MDDSAVTRLINQCSKANDVDAKVDAVTKLQAEFEAGAEIPDQDALIAVLKACLRTANQHLTTATLSALPPLLPLLIARNDLARSSSGSPKPAAASTSSATPSSIDAHALRHVLTAFLPPGGVIDRLGDSREKAREKARETLVVLGGLAFRNGGTGSVMNRSRDGKGPETPLMIFEKHLRENGLASKVWRVREQSMMTLVQVRRIHHLFPIRSYLPALVEALEDTDGAVRECARQSVVELFTGPGVTDAARADLKKEMARKAVRKGIVDSVLSKVLSGSGGGTSTPGTMSEAGSENGDANPREYVPPSIALMSRRPAQPVGTSAGASASGSALPRTTSQGSIRDLARPASRAAAVVSPPPMESAGAGGSSGADVRPIYIASAHDLENEFASMLKHFEASGKETEHNWAPREQSIQRVRGMLKGDVQERYAEAFLFGLKNGFITASLKTLASLRTTVAGNTCFLYSELAITLGFAIDPFCDILLSNLLKMASLTKKITAQHSQATVTTILSHTSPQVRLVTPLLWNSLQDKSIQMRGYVVGHVKTYIQVHCTRSRHAVEAAGGQELLEKCIKKALVDPNAGVKDSARQAFWVFESVWPDRAKALLESMDSLSRKQLEKACPNPEHLATLPSASAPVTKKSSIAAAIAASRAKARAIANAPPTLMHQATSTSHATRATSPPHRRAVSPSLSTGSGSGGSRSISPVSQSPHISKSRGMIGTTSRSVNSSVVPLPRSRASPGQPPPDSPPSPTPGAGSPRRVSNMLSSSSSSSFRRALQTALPASPPTHAITFADSNPRTTRPGLSVAVPVPRESLTLAALSGMGGADDESLLLATKIPIPEDSDSDMDESMDLVSFSSPYERYPPAPKSDSQAGSFSPKSSGSRPGPSNTLSTSTNSPPAGVPRPVVEDALRARAEQAESAAERLLELVDPEEENMQVSPLPPPLLLRNIESTPTSHKRPSASPSSIRAAPAPPRTPKNKDSSILRQAALFQDSPAPNGKPGSLFDMVGVKDNATEWWTKRTSLINITSPILGLHTDGRVRELEECIYALEQDSVDVPILKSLTLLCTQNPVEEQGSLINSEFSASPASSLFGGSQSPSPNADLWTQERRFDRLFKALIKSLDPRKKSEILEYGLIVLWEMLSNQGPLLEGKEADIFTMLLEIRYSALAIVMQATNMFRDALTSQIEPVYGLTTLHASLRAFRDAAIPEMANIDVRDGTYAFGLISIGKFLLRLPAEVLEEELPRLRTTLITALTDVSSRSSLMVREAAAAAIIAAQLVLRDEAHLFVLLDGLPDDKKNLLTYLFDKHGSRSSHEFSAPSGIEKLEREMRRLDNRTNTPPRSQTAFVI